MSEYKRELKRFHDGLDEVCRPTVQERARALWDTFDDNERHGVKFGMFPYAKMRAAEKEGYATHALVVALMLCARVAT